MNPALQYSVQLHNVNVTYYRYGKGLPLLLIPAFHTDSVRLMPLVNFLSKRFDVIMPELPGISTNGALDKQKHTAYNYAKLMAEFIRELHLNVYIICGLCFGASITVHLLGMDIPRPKALIFFEAIYRGNYIHLEFPYKIIVPFIIFLGKIGIDREPLINILLHNKTLLHTYFRFVYRHEANRDEIVVNQIRLTDTMNTRAWIDLIDDIFSTDFTKTKIVSDIPTYQFFVEHPLIDFKKNSEGMRRLFPASQVIRLNYDYHAPPGMISEEILSILLKPILPIIEKVSQVSTS